MEAGILRSSSWPSRSFGAHTFMDCTHMKVSREFKCFASSSLPRRFAIVHEKDLRRSLSGSEVNRPEITVCNSGSLNRGSRSASAVDAEENHLDDGVESSAFEWRELSDGIGPDGRGGSQDCERGSSVCNGDDWSKIGAQYEKIIRSDPGNSLLLRNYGRFLHEVEKNDAKAEEFYGRAILASPDDGEVLSLYGALIWKTQKDEDRAKDYYERAVHAAPDDCMVLGSYAHFMWEVDDVDDVTSPPVEAFPAAAMAV